MGRNELTQKQENFTQNIFQGLSQREAYIKAGYSPNSLPATLDRHAHELTKNDKVRARLAELNQRAEDAKIADVKERKEILSELVRGKLSDFVTVGADGAWFDIDGEKLNSRAIAGATSKTVLGKDGADDAVLIRVNLHDPTKAIDLLNKMDKIYSDGASVHVDSKTLIINVGDLSDIELARIAAAGHSQRSGNGASEKKGSEK